VESDLARIVTLFRAREERAKASGYLPRVGDLEWRFGRGGPKVSLGEGRGAFSLEGALDRLDASTEDRGARRAIVVDYKTSPTSARSSARKLRELEDLQLPLYARAVERLRGVTVVGLEHYAATRRERVLVGSEPARHALEARAEGKERPCVLPVADFRQLLEGAERRAVEVVLAVRAVDHGKQPLARGECEACDVRAVCRPDTSRFRARRDEGEEDA
jgi:hypothetical protein